MNLLTINIESAPNVITAYNLTPYIKSYQLDYEDVEDTTSGKNAKGIMCRDVLRTVRKISCTFRISNQTEQQLIMQATNNKSLDLLYFDTASNNDQATMTAYAGNTRSNNIYNAGNGVVYNEISITFTEF